MRTKSSMFKPDLKGKELHANWNKVVWLQASPPPAPFSCMTATCKSNCGTPISHWCSLSILCPLLPGHHPFLLIAIELSRIWVAGNTKKKQRNWGTSKAQASSFPSNLPLTVLSIVMILICRQGNWAQRGKITGCTLHWWHVVGQGCKPGCWLQKPMLLTAMIFYPLCGTIPNQGAETYRFFP